MYNPAAEVEQKAHLFQVIENIHRHRQMNPDDSSIQTILNAVKEVRGAIIADPYQSCGVSASKIYCRTNIRHIR